MTTYTSTRPSYHANKFGFFKFRRGSFPKCPEFLNFNFADTLFRVCICRARSNVDYVVPYAIRASQKTALIFQ